MRIIAIIFLVCFWVFSLHAKIYFSAGYSLGNNNLEIANNGKTELYPDFIISNTTSQKEIFCPRCLYYSDSNSSIYYTDVYKTITSNKIMNYSVSSYEIKNSITPSYTFSLGWRFLNNFRIESEFRSMSSKKQLSELLTNFNVNSSINNQYIYNCEGLDYPNMSPICPFEEMNYEENYNNYHNASENLFDLISNNGNPSYISFSNNINYYFLNFLYDFPLLESFGLFGGTGAGFATIKLNTQTNLPIDLSGKSSFYAYQYKLGTYYNINGNDKVRFLVSLTHISSLSKVKFDNFEIKPISQDSVDFTIMFIP